MDIALESSTLLRLVGPLLNTIDHVLESSSESSSDESEIEENLPKSQPDKFVDTIDSYNDLTFKKHMRLNRSTVKYLIVRYECSEGYLSQRNAGKPKVRAKKMIYMYVWYVCNTVKYIQLANLFDVCKSTAWDVVRRVASFLVSLGHEFIVWPTGATLENCRKKFKKKNKIAGAIGVIACTHMRIIAPSLHKERYVNKKQKFSISLQAVVDADKKFINVHCGEPGSLSDSSVLKKSELYKRAETNRDVLFPNSSFLLGSSAYTNSSWLVTPFTDNENLTVQQINFNKIHSLEMLSLQNAFSLWKGRFKMLKFTEIRDLNIVKNLVISTCILHNICMAKGDILSPDEYELEENNDNNYVSDVDEPTGIGSNRRGVLLMTLLRENII